MNTAISPKILVVDDTPANLVAMRRLLARCGAQLLEAGSGNEALALCLDHDFALILLDVNMPDMDGFEVAALLSETEQMRDTPIIFVTAAYADDLNRLKGYRSGAVDYIAKPINDAILQSKVRVFLDLYSARVQLQQAMDELTERNQQLQVEITERKRVEAQVRHQATHDMLTGLPNRVLFQDRLQTAMQRGSRQHHPFALALMDIDGFKAVNDSYGHPAGDALLQAIAVRLRGHLRARAGRPGLRHWLVFGERRRAPDFPYRAEIEAWQAQGVLERLDLAFSRDQTDRPYVQQRLREAAGTLREWVADGAAIYVCGGRAGMGEGVHDALIEVLGAAAMQALAREGRYRRDVY